MSSMSVYGLTTGVITEETKLVPKTNYGKSKLQAEELVLSIVNNDFNVTILRPPIIYGRGCRGNYQKLSNFVKKTIIFPKMHNIRSMVYIDNLCEYIKILIDSCQGGIFVPQNSYYVDISEMAILIAKSNSKKLWVSKALNPIIMIFRCFLPELIDKAFGSLIYVSDEKISHLGSSEVPLDKSVYCTEME